VLETVTAPDCAGGVCCRVYHLRAVLMVPCPFVLDYWQRHPLVGNKSISALEKVRKCFERTESTSSSLHNPSGFSRTRTIILNSLYFRLKTRGAFIGDAFGVHSRGDMKIGHPAGVGLSPGSCDAHRWLSVGLYISMLALDGSTKSFQTSMSLWNPSRQINYARFRVEIHQTAKSPLVIRRSNIK
jgi:hypothetical protein